ncbi:hypothetical protein VP01_1273g1 [Puccinia sorghi]|uniref:Uncharacterized protein n=1 Tax=Puccinia sorghi TaxID=27349 RepID=A0A0L6VNV4_9BASI|nr:hypothetical protein VP01_1273g1 [Puccinia sorghi]
MSNLLCLGQFIIPLHFPTPISLPEFHQPAFLHRGTSRVHIWCYPRRRIADLSQLESEMIGPSLAIPVVEASLTLSTKPEPPFSPQHWIF